MLSDDNLRNSLALLDRFLDLGDSVFGGVEFFERKLYFND